MGQRLRTCSRPPLKYLASHRMTVVAVGEKSVIEEQLRPFGMQIVDAPHPAVNSRISRTDKIDE